MVQIRAGESDEAILLQWRDAAEFMLLRSFGAWAGDATEVA